MRVRASMYIYMCVCMHVYMYVCMYVCVCMYACMYVCVCMYLRMYVRMYLCVYVCMYVRVCMYACMYVYTGSFTAAANSPFPISSKFVTKLISVQVILIYSLLNDILY
jgi:hypothetical protein